ncbi:MAG TPA: acyltransferase [Longimicrobium sp.]|nr:acyltransferase [Longimicrobium sp.]
MLASVNGLRFVAASHVMLEHTLRARLLPEPVLDALGAGYTSATLLLVLSGFVLVYVYSGPAGEMTVPRRVFWTARLSRIYPLLVVSQLLVLPVWLSTHGWAETRVPLVVGLSGMQAWFPTFAHVLNTPAWAVSVLLLGYAAFPWLLGALRRIPTRGLAAAAAVLWAVSVLPGALMPHPPEALQAFMHSFPLLRIPEFLIGMVAARWFLARGPLGGRAAGWAVAGALGGWAVILALVGQVPRAVMHNGLPAPLFVVLLVGLASGGGGVVARLLASAPMRRLGDAALAIFLLHLPVIAWVESMGWYPGPTTAASAAVYAGYLAGVLLLSLLAMERFVAPVSAWIRRAAAADSRATRMGGGRAPGSPTAG